MHNLIFEWDIDAANIFFLICENAINLMITITLASNDLTDTDCACTPLIW